MDGTATRGVAHATSGPCLQQNLVCVLEGEATDGQGTSCRRRRRPDQAPGHPRRRVDGRPRPRGRLPRPRRRRDDLERHRRRRHRQGARLLRGRDDAGAVPGRRARLHGQAAVPRAHRRLGRRVHEHRGRRSSCRPGSTSGSSPSPSRSSRESEAMWALSLPMPFTAAAPRRRRRLLRPARPLVHGPVEVARPHRDPRGAEGPPERAQEPLRPPPRARHHASTPSRTR